MVPKRVENGMPPGPKPNLAVRLFEYLVDPFVPEALQLLAREGPSVRKVSRLVGWELAFQNDLANSGP